MQNFGKIKNTFNNLLAEGIAQKNDATKAIFGKFVKTIKESKILRTQFNVYYDIEKKAEPNEFRSSEFVKESIALMNKFKKEDILAENNKLISILKENNLEVATESYDKEELHENIATLIFTKKNSSNINTIVESLEKVVNHVKENIVETKSNNDFLPNSFIGNLVVEKFNEKYADLSEDERKVFKAIVDSDEEGKKAMFESLTKECLELVNNRLPESTEAQEKEALLNVKEGLLKMEYTNESFMQDIGRIIYLKKAFND